MGASPPPFTHAARRVLARWAHAGLFAPIPGEDAYTLTVPGQFWTVQMGARPAHLVDAVTISLEESRRSA